MLEKDRVQNKAIHWFRHGLRLHDMPSMVSVLGMCRTLYPVFIFDGETAGTKTVGYNRMRFLLEALGDLDEQLKAVNGRLFVFHGNPPDVLGELIDRWSITHLSYEQDPEPIWQNRDNAVRALCEQKDILVVERVSHTLWNPKDIIEMNSGTPPLTYALFCHVSEALGLPPRPEERPDFEHVTFNLKEYDPLINKVPTPEDEGVHMEVEEQKNKIWIGGETRALQHLQERLTLESKAYKEGYYMPNQTQPDLTGPPMSMSAALRFGCLSVRKFYWDLHDLHQSVFPDIPSPSNLTGQLLWREYFYTMSVGNQYYDTMLENPICLNINWKRDNSMLQSWLEGRTGYPFIDAAMRQLVQEGWIHHVARNAVACFLTRGDLWISWEEGLKVFLKYLLDADWSVCAGNWMWVSSSAFENILQCSSCISPIYYGRRLEPTGQYIRRYVPELRNFPLKYIFEPWNAPEEVQVEAKCRISEDYPHPIVQHKEACQWNTDQMNQIKEKLLGKDRSVQHHCAPSNEDETRLFLWLPVKCIENLHPCTAH